MSSSAPVIVWFRNDLRTADNPALSEAAASGAPVLCVYIDPVGHEGLRPLGGASRWWLAGSLRTLSDALATLGGRLTLLRGDPATIIPRLVEATGARAVFWNRRYIRAETELDTGIKAALIKAGLDARSFNAHLLHEPWTITSKAGGPMKVFTPFWRAALAKGSPAAPLPAPSRLSAAVLPPDAGLQTLTVDELGYEPTAPDWAGGMRAEWTRGEKGARDRLDLFLETGLPGYDEARNRPDQPATSRLSPHLRFGEISVRQCWHSAVQAQASLGSGSQRDLETFLKELGWREFSYHLLHHNPDLAGANYTPRFDAFPWRDDDRDLAAWQRGLTGYPIVDAGMRQLWTTGWMHNRVRMIVGSFLVKHLLIPWQRGEEWFWDTLVDADPASNAASWQWVAGTGADAAPYFRIFNPILQGEKFDPDGAYVKRWLPALSRLPSSLVHKPWTAPPAILAAAGLRLGEGYPRPMVQHELARARALEAFRQMGGDNALNEA